MEPYDHVIPKNADENVKADWLGIRCSIDAGTHTKALVLVSRGDVEPFGPREYSLTKLCSMPSCSRVSIVWWGGLIKVSPRS